MDGPSPTHIPRPCDYGPFGQGIAREITVTITDADRASMTEYYINRYRAAIRGKRSHDITCERLASALLDEQERQAGCVARIEESTAMLMKLGRSLPECDPVAS